MAGIVKEDAAVVQAYGREAWESLSVAERNVILQDYARVLRITTAAADRVAVEAVVANSIRAGASAVTPAAKAESLRVATATVREGEAGLATSNPKALSAAEEATIAAASSRQAGAITVIEKKTGLSAGTLLCGATVSAFIAYALIKWKQTDGQRITITNIIPRPDGSVQVSYTAPSSTFLLRTHDTLDFSGCSAAKCIGLGDGERVTGTVSGSVCVVTPNGNLTLGSTSPGSLSPAASPGGSWGTALVHSSFSSQWTGAVADTVATAVGTVADAAAAAAAAAAPGLHSATCSLLPFLCNSTIWWILAGVCLFIIFGFIIFRFLK